jgi:hypothetical protein
MSPKIVVRRKYYGKYRGTVFENNDLEKKGRILALVPDVLKELPTTWALPCLPVTGVQSGVYLIPPKMANVWIEFEHGDVNYPIWSGGFWGTPAEIPAVAQASTPDAAPIVIQTVGQNTVWIGGDPATGITVSCGPAPLPTSPQIKISQAGVLITDGKNGSILIAAGTVTINGGALIIK